MKQTANNKINWNCCSGGNGFAVLLIIIGGYFLARDLGWIPSTISFWPMILIAFGALMLYNNKRQAC